MEHCRRAARPDLGSAISGDGVDLQQAEIGIIGGSGLYSMPGLTGVHEEHVATPFGEPSDAFVLGELEGRRVAFLARHGRGHRLLPSELNFRANIYALKKLGVDRILSVSAVGSLKEEHRPGDFLIPDQFIDRTFHRVSTFFGDGVVAHVAFGDPVCAAVAKVIAEACRQEAVTGKAGGTYVCMEGPQFSTRAESNLYRSWGADVIGMTNLQEAKLAREAEICYATAAMVTDYDCWYEGHDEVTVEQIVAVLNQNAANACRVIRSAVAAMPRERTCACGTALQYAILTTPDAIPAAARERLDLLIGKYLKHK
jgi:5'-methylthioadenosine phosphorylase